MDTMQQENPDQDPLQNTDESARGPGRFRVLKALAFVTVIVVVEVVCAAVFIPSARETEELAKNILASSAGQLDGTGDLAGGAPGTLEDVREVDLGAYNVTRYNPDTGSTLAIDVQLHGVVLAEDRADFARRFEKSRGRVGEHVVLTLHAAETSDLTDAGLGLIKRQILEKTNRALGKPLVREVLFSKFNFVER